MGMGHWRFFTAVGQPVTHELYFIRLGCFYLARNLDNFFTIGACLHQIRHFHRLAMMWYHPLHEQDIVPRITAIGNFNRLFSGQIANTAPWGTGLNNGDILGSR